MVMTMALIVVQLIIAIKNLSSFLGQHCKKSEWFSYNESN